MEGSSPSSASFFRRPPAPPSAPVPPQGIPAGAPAHGEGPGMVRRPSFHGSGGTLLGIHIINALLILVTLGVYYPWAKTRVRRYLFSETGFGLGFWPTFMAMVPLALPPILTNSFVAIRASDRDTVEAARGMGMRELQVL